MDLYSFDVAVFEFDGQVEISDEGGLQSDVG